MSSISLVLLGVGIARRWYRLRKVGFMQLCGVGYLTSEDKAMTRIEFPLNPASWTEEHEEEQDIIINRIVGIESMRGKTA